MNTNYAIGWNKIIRSMSGYVEFYLYIYICCILWCFCHFCEFDVIYTYDILVCISVIFHECMYICHKPSQVLNIIHPHNQVADFPLHYRCSLEVTYKDISGSKTFHLTSWWKFLYESPQGQIKLACLSHRVCRWRRVYFEPFSGKCCGGLNVIDKLYYISENSL